MYFTIDDEFTQILTQSIFYKEFKLLSHVGASLLSRILYPIYNLLLDGVYYKQ